MKVNMKNKTNRYLMVIFVLMFIPNYSRQYKLT